jgi:hypothetical protein
MCQKVTTLTAKVQTSFLPGRMGLPWRSSAKMQPTDHMSTAGVYLVDPISSSGGLGSQQKIDSNSAAKNQEPKCISPIDPKQPSSGLHNEVP